jgi:hypothetical protein
VFATLKGFEIKPDRSGFIEPNTITVTVPKKADVSAANLTAGILTPLKFGCVVPNDMVRVVIQGTVSF